MMKELPAPLVPVAIERGLRPAFPVKAHRFPAGMRPRRVLVSVVERQAKAFRQCQRGRVLGVDELGMLLDDLAVFEVPAPCPDPAARHRVVLVDLRPDAGPGPEPVSAAQPRDARADNDDARLARAAAGGSGQTGRPGCPGQDAGTGNAEK